MIKKFTKRKKLRIDLRLLKFLSSLILVSLLIFINYSKNSYFLIYKDKVNNKNKVKDNKDKFEDKFKDNDKGKVFINQINHFNISVCFAAIGREENLYARELIDYYLKIGINKFFIGDDNLPNTEKLSDVLQDYIKNGIVEIIDIIGKNISQEELYNMAFERGKNYCNWMTFYDFDEYLTFNDPNMTMQSYLSFDTFNKCDVVKIHWLLYDDNDYVYYQNRPMIKRFTRPIRNSFDNLFHKSIVKVKNYNGKLWQIDLGPHQPKESLVNMCDAVGELANVRHGILGNPNYKYGHIKHFRMKTAEEFAKKIKRGHPMSHNLDFNELVDKFFKHNKFTKEKLQVIEKILNRTYPKYYTFNN